MEGREDWKSNSFPPMCCITLLHAFRAGPVQVFTGGRNGEDWGRGGVGGGRGREEGSEDMREERGGVERKSSSRGRVGGRQRR